MDRLLTTDELFELGRDVEANYQRPFEVHGRPITNVEMMASLLYGRYSFMAQVSDFCKRFDEWLESEVVDDDRHRDERCESRSCGIVAKGEVD